MKYALVIILLLALAQNALAEEIFESEHGIRLHILTEKDLYVFETVNYTTMSGKAFEGTLKLWLPNGAANITISEVDEVHFTPLDFELQGNLALFKLAIPESNYTSIYISYDMRVEPQGFLDKQFEFETVAQYPVERFTIVIISQPNYNVTSSDNLGMLMPFRYSAQYNAYITGLANKDALHAQQKLSVKFTLSKTQELLPYIGIAIVAVGALAVALVFFLKKKDRKEGSDAEYDAIMATLREIEEDYRSGKLSEEEYRKLKGEYEARKASAEKKKRR